MVVLQLNRCLWWSWVGEWYDVSWLAVVCPTCSDFLCRQCSRTTLSTDRRDSLPSAAALSLHVEPVCLDRVDRPPCRRASRWPTTPSRSVHPTMFFRALRRVPPPFYTLVLGHVLTLVYFRFDVVICHRTGFWTRSTHSTRSDGLSYNCALLYLICKYSVRVFIAGVTFSMYYI